ncbi:uncharacterized protein BO87DRAFT_429012 [Aspergillus neoniger CBS 115656]|uniref:Uncharacterized protein n=2 Tax=Aspergillus subgen. Circumdati TaxID=2720871 RepID=A0A318Y9V5_ASPNB|nr:hypothetical protein BO87DRAFT_429012 [Aspergillus neoniger CBS 115656]XP_025540802.1 hypothetical protein BO79DRAFT_286916 [Aspergillus costaricaensis CBS 115574]PYH31111.1 hypothetical protein BO87DRAFT_429012 [Aspergillus neoniger CBS 115656]RAK89967.1 hypothetical protein BO79DRAFT_286916 [Aspergillus costaricaensis CBS 115574]
MHPSHAISRYAETALMPGMHDLDQRPIHANCLGSPTLLSYDDSYWDIGGQEREGMSLHLAFHKGKQVECELEASTEIYIRVFEVARKSILFISINHIR